MKSDFSNRIAVALLALFLTALLAPVAALGDSAGANSRRAACRIADAGASGAYVYFDTLADAIDAAGTGSLGVVVEIVRDVEMDRCLTVKSDKSITLTSAPDKTFTLTNSRISDNYVIDNDSARGEMTLVNITVDGEGKFRSAVFNGKKATLNIKDGTLVTGIANGSDYGLSCVVNNGYMNMLGGVIDGGEIGINNTYKLYMSGGAIDDAKTGVYNSGTFVLSGGVIRGVATGADGNLKCNTGVENYGLFEMSGGSVTSCAVRGVYNSGSSTLKMSGGEITDCLRSGGVYNYGDFVMAGGKIKNCAQTGGIDYLGGGVTVDGGSFIMSAGEISDCAADGHRGAGGVGIFTGGSFEMSNDGLISNCSGRGENGAGGVALVRGSFDMAGGAIENCKGTGEYAAGGVALVSGSISVSGGEISFCEGRGAYGAGGIVLVSGTLDISGGRLSGCKGLGFKSAGGIGYNYGNLNISGGEISGCEGTRSGGVDMFYDSVLNISGDPVISGNSLTDGTACNILCTMEQLIKITGNLKNSTPIGVTLKKGAYVTQLSDVDYSERFSSDDEAFAVASSDFGDNRMVALVNQYEVALGGEAGISGFEVSLNGTDYAPYVSPVKVKQGGELRARALVNEACDFAGWTDGTKDNPRVIGSIEKNMAFKALTTAKDFVVSFGGVRNGSAEGNDAANYKSAYGAAIAPSVGYGMPESVILTVGGLPFDEFEYDPARGVISVAAGKITGDVAISCDCPAVRYAIICDLGGGSAGIPESYSVDSPDITLTTPVRTGYAFTGWSGDGLSGSDNLAATIKKGSVGDKSFKANWKPLEYRLEYELDSGKLEKPNPLSYTVETQNLTLNNPAKEHYVFKGWSGTGLVGAGNRDVVVAKGSVGDRSFQANWVPETYAIEYELDGGEQGSGNPSSYTIETRDITLQSPTKVGYSFAGWTGSGLAGDGDTKVVIGKGSFGDRSYRARWTPSKYLAVCEIIPGDLDSAETFIFTIESDDITLKNPRRKNYVFTGWSGTGLEGDDNFKVTVPKGSVGDRRFIANWSPEVYSIKYDLGEGAAASDNPSVYTILSNDIVLNAPSRKGYVFTGWSGTDLKGNNNKTVIIKRGGFGDRSYSANWAMAEYTIKFDKNGATSGYMAEEEFKYGEEANLAPNAFERVNKVSFELNESSTVTPDDAEAVYAFDGWSTERDGSGERYADEASVAGLTDNETDGIITLYAQWTGGEVALPAPEAEYREFGGWYADADCEVLAGGGGQYYAPAGDVTLYAAWKTKTYDITLTDISSGIRGFETSADGVSYAPYTGPVAVERAGSLYVRAIAKSGFTFEKWSDGDTRNPRVITNVTEDARFMASSTINGYAVTVKLTKDGKPYANRAVALDEADVASVPSGALILEESDAGVYTNARVLPGRYHVYVDGANTGRTLTNKMGCASAISVD